MDRRIRRFGGRWAVVALTALGAFGIGSLSANEGAETAAADAPTHLETGPATVPADTLAAGLGPAFRTAAREALPGVVHIRVESTRNVNAPDGRNPFDGTPFEDFFRRDRPQQQAPRMGSGSGFVFRPDGYILTNNHVVAGATDVTVVFPDKRQMDATVVGRDPNTDIAVVKVDAEGLPVLPLGDSDALQVGDWVVALGYPLELGSTVTAGIVSAKGKSLGIIGRSEQASAPLEHFIQTDAAINPGNSGGPLVDLDGRVVGINSAIASPTGYYSGYGFAVPVSLAHRVATDLIEHGEVRRPKLGVAIRDPSLADAEAAGLKRPFGALVASVEEGSPADDAGLEMNDAIVAVEDQAVETSGDLMELVARQEPGATITLEVVRRGERTSVEVELDDSFEPAVARTEPEAEAEPTGLAKLGFQAADLSPALAERLGVTSGAGVAVTGVEPTSPAARAGLRPGMIVESVDGAEVESLGDLESLAAELEDGMVTTLIVRIPGEAGERRTVLNVRVGA